MVSYAERPWLEHYDPGVPRSLKPYPDKAAFELLDDAVKEVGDKAACITSVDLPLFGRRHASISYRELGEESDRLAGALAAMGLQKGDRVGVLFPNSVQFVLAWFAIAKAGGIVVALNPSFPPAKYAEQLVDADIKIVIAMSLFYKGINSVREATPVEKVIVSNYKEYLPGIGKFLFTLAVEKKEGHYVESLRPGDVWLQDLLTQYAPEQRPQVDIDPREDTVIFQYTGGTTGVPKAARGPHSALVSNAYQMMYWMDLGEDFEDRSLAAIPLFHVYGMVAVMLLSVQVGATMIMVPNARDIDDVLGVIDMFKPTRFMGVPALYNAINFHPDVVAGKYDLSSIRACISGSAPLAPETKRRFEELTGGKVMEGFGMSEAPTATHCNPMQGVNKVGSIGLPFPDNDCQIVSLDDGKTILPVGEVGELVMRGPVMMTGYHNMPTETANALREMDDGNKWLFTGDIARMDEEGYFFIVDRKKDMVLIGGFNVYPNNVEKVMVEHEGIAEAAVAGIPHPEKEGQETLKAWVVRTAGSTVTADEIIDYCSGKLAPYEVPRRIDFVDELPKTAVGKILRRELVKMEVDG